MFIGVRLRSRHAALGIDRANFNDTALSLYVESGTWVVCRDAYFRGGCRSFEPGRYDELAVFGLDHVISSLRPGGPGTAMAAL